MKWLTFLTIIALLLLLYVYESSRILAKRERHVLLLTIIIGAAIIGILVFFPKTPGPTKWIEALFRVFIKE